MTSRVMAEYNKSEQEVPQGIGPEHEETKEELPVPDLDKLSEVFCSARCYIAENTFIYSFLMTILRAILILNGISTFGGNIWQGTFEGMEVFRFFLVMSTVLPNRALDMLRGGVIKKGTPLFADGKYRLSLLNIPGVPSPRQVRKYRSPMIGRSLRPDNLSVGSAMKIFRSINAGTCVYGLTVDAVHGESRTSVVNDGSGNPMLVGLGTREDLKGACLYAGDLEAVGLVDGALNKDLLGRMLLTVQLHDFMTDFSVLLAVIPLVCETGPTIANIILSVREIIFKESSYLVYAGSDWAAANRAAFNIVKSQSSGNESTRLDDVVSTRDLPFFFGTDLLEHALKHLKLQAELGMYCQSQEIHINQALYDIRGVNKQASDSTLVLSCPGDIRQSSYNGRLLVDIFNGNQCAAVAYHKELAAKMTADVICQTDPMASRPAFLMCKLAPYLSLVGASGEAWYCSMMDQLYCFAKGVSPTGQMVTPSQNVLQGVRFISTVNEWKGECETLCQDLLGGSRQRGFVTTELYDSLTVTVGSFSSLNLLFDANDGIEMKRSTIPMSWVNETTHAHLRACSTQVHVDVCAREVGSLLNMFQILADPARNYKTGLNEGGKQTYQGSMDQDEQLRAEAIERVRTTGEWAYELALTPKPKLTAEQKAENSVKRRELKAASVATNTSLIHFTASFRQSMAPGQFTKYTTCMARRSLLAQGMLSPGKLMNPDSKNRSRTFEVKQITLVKDGCAFSLVCELGGATGWIIPQPTRMSLEIRLRRANGTRSSYTFGLRGLVSLVMELKPGVRVADLHSIVVVTFLFVVCGKVEVVSFIPLKNDRGICTMLANLKPLQAPLLKAASTDGDTIPPEVELVGSWARGWLQPAGAAEALSAPIRPGIISRKFQ